MSQIIRRPAANRDLVTTYRYYAREAGLRVADRFFAEMAPLSKKRKRYASRV